MRSPDHLNSARVARHAERMKAKGLTRYAAWIPNTQAAKDAMKALAAKLRGEK